MRLITAHRILIATAVVFFSFFALFELRGYAATGGLTDLAGAALGVAAAVAFALYLRTVWRR